MALMDLKTIEAGIPSLTLMERAGRASAEIIIERYLYSHPERRTVVLCGPGNNGGDGLVVARVLGEAGYIVTAIVCQAARYSADFLTNYKRIQTSSAVVYVFPEEPESGSIRAAHIEEEDLRRLVRECHVIVDAVLGTGQTGAPRGVMANLISLVEEERELYPNDLIALDIPTGVNATTGEVYEPACRSQLTVGIQCVKRGTVQYPARLYCGELSVVDIGIASRGGALFRLFEKKSLDFPGRSLDAHKGTYKKVLVAAGSEEMPGAAILTAHAALRTGAPLVVKLSAEEIASSQLYPEIMRLTLTTKQGTFGKMAFKDLKPKLSQFGVIVLGPGLMVTPETKAFVHAIVVEARKLGISVVLDADGLNCIVDDVQDGDRDLSHCILTPHPGEAGRLLARDAAQVQSDRYAAAIDLHERTGAIIILKGASTITFGPAGGIVNCSGNPYMATGGSGDVLSGIIGGLLSQGFGLFDAAQWGVYLHGCAGDVAHQRHNGPIIAGDITTEIPRVIGEVLHG